MSQLNLFGNEQELKPQRLYQAASLLCSCPLAQEANHSFARRQRKIEQATESIKELFVRNEDGINLNAIDPDIMNVTTSLLERALTPIIDKMFWKVTIEISGGVKASISRSGKDKITVERTDGIKRKVES